MTIPISEPEVRAFVGPRADHYLKSWSSSLDGESTTSGWNWAAFFLSGLWLAYRKMYAAALIFYAIILVESALEEVLVVGVLGRPEASMRVSRLVGLVAGIVCATLGNRWYLSHARSAIAQLREQRLEGEEYLQALAMRGGTNLLASLGMFALFFALMIGLVFGMELLGISEYGKRLEFKDSELYYQAPVTEAEARKLGEYLLDTEFFDGAPKTVQLKKSGRTYQFRMVVNEGVANDADFALIAQIFGKELSEKVFAGEPVHVHLCDDNLETLKVIQVPDAKPKDET